MDKFKKDTQKLIDKGKLGEIEGQSLIDDVTAIQDSISVDVVGCPPDCDPFN